MKKLLFAAAVLLAGLTSCQQKGYTITGTVDAEPQRQYGLHPAISRQQFR